jgi:adenosylmethionine-8-amino-7-oxononanoate aminotransferase
MKNYQDSKKSTGKLKNWRQCGTILAMELSQQGESSYFHEARNQLYYHFLDKDILLRPLGNVLYILPPYCIEDQDLQRVYHEINALDQL